MKKITLKASLLIISLLVFNFGLQSPFLPIVQRNEGAPIVSAILAPVNSVTAFSVNASDPIEYFDVPILEPGVYSMNVSCYTDSGLPAPGPGVTVDFLYSMEMWYPHIGTVPGFQSMASAGWWPQNENETRGYFFEEVAVMPGAFRIEFTLTNTDPDDQMSGNVTVTQELAFSMLPYAQPLGQNSTISFSQDNSWMGLRVNLPENGLYNITAFSAMNWSTTGGWVGDATFRPFDDVMLIELIHGRYDYYNDPWHMISYNIPAGADTNGSTWGPDFSLAPMEAGDYYLLGNAEDFEFLNGSLLEFTFNISPIPTQILYPSVPLQLAFNTTPNVYDTYIAVTIPEGHYFSSYFSNPVGQNWTVMTYDAWTGAYSGPMFQTYADPSGFYIDQENLERGWVTEVSMGGFPAPGLVGDWNTDWWTADATYSIYVNGTNVGAIPPGGLGALSRFNTFYFRVLAIPTGTPNTTFHIDANFEITPFPELTASGLTFDFNSTIGPFYHIFQVPQASGAIYKVNALASNYTSTGTIALEDLEQSKEYENWQWMGMFLGSPLAYGDPAAGPGASMNTNDTATLTYVSVKDFMNYLWVQGPGMVGGDMTEGNVSLEITPSTPYFIGTVGSATVAEKQFASYTFNVAAGTTYYFEFTLKPDGEEAVGYFLDPFGYSPFVTSGFFDLFIAVATTLPFSTTYTGTFTARMTGRVSLVIVGGGPIGSMIESPVEFYIGIVTPPFSMPMIAAIVLTAIIMVVVGIFVGYLITKRRFLP